MHRRSMLLAAASAAALGGALLVPATSTAVSADPSPASIIHGSDPDVTCYIGGLFGAYDETQKFQSVTLKNGNVKLSCHFDDVGVYPSKTEHRDGFSCSIYDPVYGSSYTYDTKAVITTKGDVNFTCQVKKQ